MITCPSCQTPHLPGTFFCSECGASFLPGRNSDTTASLGVPSVGGADTWTQPPLMQAPAHDTAAPTLRVVILNSGRKLGFSSDKPILIGRQDSGRSFYPDIDLSADGGLDGGVSRKHANITMVNDIFYIEDLASSNGTYINKERIAPNVASELRHGDEVRLGNILLRIELAR